jgi:glutamine amidotransferase
MSKARVAIVDYGMGNVGSVANMLRRIGVEASITRDLAELSRADKLVLPGVGAFDRGMENLTQLGLVDHLTNLVQNDERPILGICLGMQLMTARSEEGQERGLGWLDAETIQLERGANLRIPHMGWNYVRPVNGSPLFDAEDEEQRYYFVHSYRAVCRNPADVAAVATYGSDFVAAFSRGRIHGVQFHPEKSHRFGMALLRRFVEAC